MPFIYNEIENDVKSGEIMYKENKIKELGDSDKLIRYAVGVILKQILSAAAGFFGACASFDGLAPFGVSVASAVFPEYIPASVLGASAGYFRIYGITVLTLRYIAASAVAGIIAYLFKRSFKKKYHKYFCAAASFFPVFATGLIISLSVTLSADEVVLYFAEAVVAALGAWFFNCFLYISPDKKCLSRLNGAQTASLLVVIGVLLLSLCGFEIFIFSPAVILGAYIVLTASSYGGDRYGALTGICAGAVLGLSIENGGFITGGIALGGLLAGFFGRRNRFISSVILIITVSVAAFASDDWLTASNIIYDVGIASLLFIFTPGKLSRFYKGIFAVSDSGAFLDGQRGVLRSRLNTASDGMKSVSSSVKAVAGIYRRRAFPDSDSICDNTKKRICSDCEMYSFCWDKNPEATKKRFGEIASSLKRSDSPEKEALPESFINTCVKSGELIKTIGYEVERYRSLMRESAKTGETVNIVSDQLSCVSSLLDELSCSFSEEEEYDAPYSELVSSSLEKELEIKPFSCGVFRNIDGHIYCEMCLPSGRKYSYGAIAEAVSSCLSVPLEAPVTRQLTDGKICFTVCEKTKYRIIGGGCQISSGGGKWCGDTFDTFYDGKGHFTMLLSDGMGTGKSAAADSVICSSLACVMLKSGYPIDSILKMINSAMLIRSGEESLATLDIAVINLYTGEVEFYKAGAGFSVVMKHMKLLKVEKPSLPVGILGDIAFEKTQLSLRGGDTVVIMSDGVTQSAVSAWRDILKSAADYEGKELADKLSKTAVLNSDSESEDDITVITAVLMLND